MTEYWKSYAKKYCDVCKCWITDNKASVQFHESGKRHKENVAKKISDLVKKATKDNEEKKQLDDDMRQMEEAAMKAYMKDIEENPDHSAQYVKEKIDKHLQSIAVPTTSNKCQEKTKEYEEDSGGSDDKQNEIKEYVSSISSERIWYEAKSDEGYTYYWNTQTNETVWEAPENFVTIEEQNKETERQKAFMEEQSSNKGSNNKRKNEEVRAAIEREKFKEIYSVHRSSDPASSSVEDNDDNTPVCGPQVKPDPYGQWTAVVHKEEPQVDLQLPPSYQPVIHQPVSYAPVEPRVKIKEKTIDSSKLSDLSDGPTSFKKRKFGNRGNTRQRFDDDE